MTLNILINNTLWLILQEFCETDVTVSLTQILSNLACRNLSERKRKQSDLCKSLPTVLETGGISWHCFCHLTYIIWRFSYLWYCKLRTGRKTEMAEGKNNPIDPLAEAEVIVYHGGRQGEIWLANEISQCSVCVCLCALCVFVSLEMSMTHSPTHTFSFSEAIKSSTQFPAASSRLVCHSASLVRGISSLLLLFTALISHPWILIHLAINPATAKASIYTSACCAYMCLTGCVGGWREVFFVGVS